MRSRSLRRLFAVLALTGTTFLNCPLFAQWTQTSGPGGGTVTCFLAGGSTVYAGTGYHGVYRSTDRGSTWSPARTGLVSLSIKALLSTGPALFAATGSGVHISTDGGQYWNLLSASPHGATSLALAGASLLVGVESDGVYRSTDSGVTWQQTLTLYSVTCLTVSGTSVFAGTQGSGVYVSSNGGVTWKTVSAGLTGGRRSPVGCRGNDCREWICPVCRYDFAGGLRVDRQRRKLVAGERRSARSSHTVACVERRPAPCGAEQCRCVRVDRQRYDVELFLQRNAGCGCDVNCQERVDADCGGIQLRRVYQRR